MREEDIERAAKVIKESLELDGDVMGMDGKSRKMEMKEKICLEDNFDIVGIVTEGLFVEEENCV